MSDVRVILADMRAEHEARIAYREAARHHKHEVVRLRKLGDLDAANQHADAAASCFVEAGYSGDEIADRLARYVGP